MREILFRAKRIDNGEWAEGFYQNRFDVNEDIEHLIFWRKSYTVWEYAKIDPETLCQYTGLKDKNGNRIWENDIVRTTKFGKDDGNGHNYAGFDVFVVKWDDGGFALFNKWRRFNLRTDEKSYEILGKVFDNPELLKGE